MQIYFVYYKLICQNLSTNPRVVDVCACVIYYTIKLEHDPCFSQSKRKIDEEAPS